MPTASASPLLGCDIHDRWGAVAGQMLIRPDKDKVHAPTASLRSACVAGQAGEDDVQPEGDAGAGVVLQLAGFQDAPEVGVALLVGDRAQVGEALLLACPDRRMMSSPKVMPGPVSSCSSPVSRTPLKWG